MLLWDTLEEVAKLEEELEERLGQGAEYQRLLACREGHQNTENYSSRYDHNHDASTVGQPTVRRRPITETTRLQQDRLPASRAQEGGGPRHRHNGAPYRGRGEGAGGSRGNGTRGIIVIIGHPQIVHSVRHSRDLM